MHVLKTLFDTTPLIFAVKLKIRTEMKKTYETPAMYAEEFIPNEYISTCYIISGTIDTYCQDTITGIPFKSGYWNGGEDESLSMGDHEFKADHLPQKVSVYIPKDGARPLSGHVVEDALLLKKSRYSEAEYFSKHSIYIIDGYGSISTPTRNGNHS